MTEDFNISGTWINRMTGDKIMVRNTIIDGDDMIILTSDGRQLSMGEFQNYIQMSSENSGQDDTSALGDIRNLESERRVVVGANVPKVKETPKNDFYSFSEIEPIEKPEKKEPKKQKVKTEQKTISESEKLLNKLFEKIELDVDVKVDLDCTNFPRKELNMLQTIYDVSIDEISNYILKNVINEEVIRSAVSSYVKEQLSGL